MACPHKLGGIVALSTWLALLEKVPALINEANKDTPIFQAHGEIDTIVRHDWAVKSRDLLRDTYGREIEWHSYPDLEHSADPQEIDALQKWMEMRIPPLGDFFNPQELERARHWELTGAGLCAGADK
jgi:predicted esterase